MRSAACFIARMFNECFSLSIVFSRSELRNTILRLTLGVGKAQHPEFLLLFPDVLINSTDENIFSRGLAITNYRTPIKTEQLS